MIGVALLSALAVINLGSGILYAITSFGNAILFHIGYHLCTIFTDGDVCPADNLRLVVVWITLGGIVLFPGQLYRLRRWINWRLAVHIAISQQVGVIFGEYALFSLRSIVVTRILSIFFFAVALQKVAARGHAATSATQSLIAEPEAEPEPTAAAAAAAETATTATICDLSAVDGPGPTFSFFPLQEPRTLLLVYVVGVCSGIFGGLLGTGGPPLIWFAGHAKLHSQECRATFALGFLLETISRLLYIFLVQTALVDLVSLSTLAVFVLLTLTSAVALALGNYIASATSQETFEYSLVVVLAGGAVVIGVDGLDERDSLALGAVLAAIFTATSLYFNNKCGGTVLCRRRQNKEAEESKLEPQSPPRFPSELILTVSAGKVLQRSPSAPSSVLRAFQLRLQRPAVQQRQEKAYLNLPVFDHESLHDDFLDEDGLDKPMSQASLAGAGEGKDKDKPPSLSKGILSFNFRRPPPATLYSVLPQRRFVDDDDLDVIF